MAPYLKQITSLPSSPLHQLDPSILSSLEKANGEELAKLDTRLEEAEKTEGESEISDVLKARANYLTRIGDKVRLRSFLFASACSLTSVCSCPSCFILFLSLLPTNHSSSHP